MFLNHKFPSTLGCPPYTDDELPWVVWAFIEQYYLVFEETCRSNLEKIADDYDADVALRVLWLNLRTHIDGREYFWEPLFTRVTGRPSLGGVQSEADAEEWDRIIPIGCEMLLTKKASIPSHEGPLPERIPNLLFPQGACT